MSIRLATIVLLPSHWQVRRSVVLDGATSPLDDCFILATACTMDASSSTTPQHARCPALAALAMLAVCTIANGSRAEAMAPTRLASRCQTCV